VQESLQRPRVINTRHRAFEAAWIETYRAVTMRLEHVLQPIYRSDIFGQAGAGLESKSNQEKMTTHTAERATPRMTLREEERRHKEVFQSVLQGYRAATCLPPTTAREIDPAPTSRPKWITETQIDYKIDVQKATEKAIGGDPKLEAAWFDLLDNLPVAENLAHTVITKCGRLYRSRGLSPALYFQIDRYPHRRDK